MSLIPASLPQGYLPRTESEVARSVMAYPADNGGPGSEYGRTGSDRARPLSDGEVAARLIVEFEGTHGPEMVSRCVSAARKGAEAVMGSGTPDLVERVARKHLQVLAIVAAERHGQMTLRPAP